MLYQNITNRSILKANFSEGLRGQSVQRHIEEMQSVGSKCVEVDHLLWEGFESVALPVKTEWYKELRVDF